MIKKLFEHSLPTDDLVIRQFKSSDSTRIEEYFGKVYPIIRLKDVVFDAPSIVNFSMSFSDEMLTIPSITIEINDADFNQRDANFVEKDSIITIFVGNAKDEHHKPIKNNYYVVDATIDDTSGSYYIEAVLDVRDLYYSQNRVFANKSSLEVFQFIAKECKLGFVTNIEDTADKMNWIQYQPNINFLSYLNGRSYIDDTTKVMVFIDQFANLNVIDLKNILESPATTTFLTDSEGKLLENDLTFRMSNWSYGYDKNEHWALIDSLSPINNVGQFSRRFSMKLQVNSLDMMSMKSTNVEIDSGKIQLKELSTFTSYVNDNTFHQYDKAKQLNGNYNNHLHQGQKLSISTNTFYPQIFMMLGLQIEVFDAVKIKDVDSQDPKVTNDNFDENVQTENQSLNANKNIPLSGKYIIRGIRYNFSYSNDDSNQVRQHIIVAKI